MGLMAGTARPYRAAAGQVQGPLSHRLQAEVSVELCRLSWNLLEPLGSKIRHRLCHSDFGP